MKIKDSISEVARLLHVSPSALRYWEQEGLVRFERSPDNQYRVPSMQTMMDLCEVILYREIAIPIKEIRALPQMDAFQIREVLTANEKKLEEQRAALEAAIFNIQEKKQTLNQLIQWRDRPFFIESCRLPAIRSFSFQDEEALRIYLHDSYDSAIAVKPDSMGAPRPIEYGIFVPEAGEGQESLKEPDQVDTLYLRGLFQAESAGPDQNNAAAFFDWALKNGYRPGAVYGRYLVSACDGKRYDYYEAWMRLFPGPASV